MSPASPYPITGPRELILQRIQDVLKTIAPATTFTFPNGWAHAPITNDLGTRVYSKFRGEVAIDQEQRPYVELITDAKTPDKIESKSNDWYTCTMTVQVWCYAAGDDSGDGLDSIVRPQLNSLCSDLWIGIEAVPYWTGPVAAPVDSLKTIFGPRLSVDVKARWTRPAVQGPGGFAFLTFEVSYPFDRLNP